tara:strand:+ start:168 stop:539 length:372 start_codon:yes stop_codon:yes gene_type:complete
MSLIVDFRNIDKAARVELNQYQETIGYYMMAIGMGEITQKNHLEVYARLVLLEATNVDVLAANSSRVTKYINRPWISFRRVKLLIGSKFNIAFESKAKFSSRMMKATLSEVERLAAKESKEVA